MAGSASVVTRADETEPAGTKISSPTLSLPRGGGAVRGIADSVESQDFTGSATFSIPIHAPAIRGTGPAIALSYGSGAGNGPFGVGFDVAMASIARRTTTGIPRYTDDDVFVFSSEGELVPVREETRREQSGDTTWTVDVYVPRHEGAFSRIERWTRASGTDSHWRVRTRDNFLSIFGRSDDSRIYDADRPDRVFQWLIDSTEDRLGNNVRYTYRREDEVNVPPAIYEAGRDHRANRYPSTIEYGNYWHQGQELFAGRIVFDYGGFPVDDPDAPFGEWTVRPDPFSSYRSGFEIRTLRRCHGILTYLCFHDQFGGEPCLTRALRLDYREQPNDDHQEPLSLIERVTQIGYRRESAGGYRRQPMPPTAFGYAPFDPTKQRFQQLVVEGQDSIPGDLSAGRFAMVDLRGEGLPGLLYSAAGKVLYWEPLGDGHYAGPSVPETFPIDNDLSSAELALTSLDGNGELDLVVRAPTRSGFYRSIDEGQWTAFRAFESGPIDLLNPQAASVDMNGNGRADLVMLQDHLVLSYPSLGTRGYGGADVAVMEPRFPAADVTQAEVLTYADMFGDGLSHRVRITNGLVECWPNLGYGRFGSPVRFGNAPRFGARLDRSRLFLADVDGSGLTDLIHVESDSITIYFNESGNRFSAPVVIPLPVPYDDSSQVTFADVNGRGTASFILTTIGESVTHYVYDFTGDVKPYVLTEIDNQAGAVTRLHYTTSVKQYLEDKRHGRPWATRLFFPVQLVERIERLDRVSKARYANRRRYHDGYYDPQERTFRGFGYVESWDTETYDDLIAAARVAGFAVEPVDKTLYVPPAYTRTWFQTGAYQQSGPISAQYEREFWKGDPDEYLLPQSAFSPDVYAEDSETIRQAYAAMAGQTIRREIYGLDGSALEPNPYSVSESSVTVRLVRPRGRESYAVFLAYPRESLTYDYERDPADPRLKHSVTLDVDQFGNPLLSCEVGYPRRKNRIGAGPQQDLLLTGIAATKYFNHVDTSSQPYRLLGVAYESRQLQIEGLTRPAKCFSFDELKRQIDLALKDAIAYGQPFTPGKLEGRVTTWSRTLYWNDALTTPLPIGEVSSRALVHHIEQAVYTQALLAEAFRGKGDVTELAASAGYWFDAGYWWDRGLIQRYAADPKLFFLAIQTDGAFAGVDLASSLNPTTTTTFDAYPALPTASTQYLHGMPGAPETLGLTVSVENDYQTLSPWRLTDVNDNVGEVLFDPLGMVIVATSYGVKDGRAVGDRPLRDYVRQASPTFDEVIVDPPKYVQGASSFFYYNLFAWSLGSQPVCAVTLKRQIYASDLQEGQENPIETGIVYWDGFARSVEGKRKTVDNKWITSGRTVYNNKAKPAEQYLPFFSDTPRYEEQGQVNIEAPPPVVVHYDPIERRIRTDAPKGFFAKVEFTPWRVDSFDEDDTVLDSEFYRGFPANPTTPAEKNEKDALDKAARFYNTPAVAILDPLGRTVLSRVNNLGAVTPSDFDEICKGSGITPQALWERLVADGYLMPDRLSHDKAWVTEKLQPYDAAFQTAFRAEFPTLAAPLLALLKENGLTTQHVLDVLDRELLTIDPRLLYSNVTEQSGAFNFRYLFGMTGNAIRTEGADGGDRWVLPSIFGSPVYGWDSRGFRVSRTYDRLNRPTSVRVEGGDGEEGVNKFAEPITTEVLIYGETQPDPADRNLNGRLYQFYDQAGLLTQSSYTLGGQLVSSTRQLRDDYQKEADWTRAAMDRVARQEAFATASTYDEEGRVTSQVTPDGNVTTSSYSVSGQLVSATCILVGVTPAQTIVERIDYDANGQRTRISYGNGVVTSNSYERTTLRLIRIDSTRPGVDATPAILQQIAMTYDPVGNLTRKEDSSWATVFCYNQPVDPLADYTCDALYHVVRATGRQHPGLSGPAGDAEWMPFCPPDIDDQTKLENYIEKFSYDDGGNLIEVRHVATASWTRAMPVAARSNRLAESTYDADGNIAGLGDTTALAWNYRNNIGRADVIVRANATSDSEYYLYDGSGNRVLKVSERVRTVGGGEVVDVQESIYLGTYQVRRSRQRTAAGTTTTLQRGTLSVGDGQNRACLIDQWTTDVFQREVERPGETRYRYQLSDNLGSVALEVDEAGQRITYEEYLPYGGTAFIAGANAIEVERKEYRYSGKEFDGMTGLYDYGGRYYPPWYGRWINPDPSGADDGLNVYAFVGGNPLSKVDSDGRNGLFGWAVGGLVTLAIGGLGGHRSGNGLGTTSGAFMGAVAGTVGAIVGGLVAGATAPAIATAVGVSVATSLVGSAIGGYLGRQATSTVSESGGTARQSATAGALTSGLIGGGIGALSLLLANDYSALIPIASGAGAAVLSSGSHLGFVRRGDAFVTAVELTDTSKIRLAIPPSGVPEKLPAGRLLLTLAPQKEAESRFNSSFKKEPAAAFRLKPKQPKDDVTNPEYHTIAVHGFRGYVLVPTGTDGNDLRPISIELFAGFVAEQLEPYNDDVPIKLISCFGGACGLLPNAQVIADVTGRSVFAFAGPEMHDYAGEYTEFRPRKPKTS
jgi:RHS repeat-associated protein